MTAMLQGPLLQNAARLRLPELLSYFEVGVHLSIQLWDGLCKETLQTGDVDALHAQRDQCQSFLRGGQENLDVCLRVVDSHADPESAALRARMIALRDQLATKYSELFPKWQTTDDLEDILLARMISPLAARIELAKRFPPPQSWYDETEDPFAPVESPP